MMIKPLFSILICFFLFIPDLLFSQLNYGITDIQFVGNATFSEASLLGQMSMNDRNFMEKKVPFFKEDPFTFSQDILTTDTERIRIYYQQEGFLYVKIQSEIIDLNHDKETLKLKFIIEEGPPMLVDSLQFKIVPDSIAHDPDLPSILDAAREELELLEGERFRDAVIAADRDKLITRLNNFGFPYANVVPELTVNETDRAVDILWRVESGIKCIFGDVLIDGYKLVPEGSIRRQLTIKPGDTFSRREIDKTQQQIYALGMFQIVSVKSVLISAEQRVIPVQIQIKEAKGFRTKFGVGYGTEEKLRLTIDSRILGFMGGTRRLNLFLKRSSIEPYHADLEVVQPAFLTPKSTLIVNPFVRRQEEPGYTVNRAGIRTTVNHPFTNRINGAISYVFEDVDQDTSGLTAELADNGEFEGLYNKSSIILSGSYDNSRPLFTPNQGMFHQITYKFSGLGFGSDFNYNKLQIDLRRYQRFRGNVLAYRLKIGSIRSFDESEFIPVEDRFYAGGATSVRGWGRQQLGPKDTQGNPIGGSSLLEGSLEMRYRLVWDLGGVFFWDFGNVWEGFSEYRLNEIRHSLGFGLRYATPIGPIRIDAARPIRDVEDRWQFHFSVGHAF